MGTNPVEQFRDTVLAELSPENAERILVERTGFNEINIRLQSGGSWNQQHMDIIRDSTFIITDTFDTDSPTLQLQHHKDSDGDLWEYPLPTNIDAAVEP